MAEALVSFIFEHSTDIVWRTLRDFGGICSWLPPAKDCQIEDGLAADQIGAIRRFSLSGALVREQLLALSDQDHSCSYLLLQGPLPVRNMIGAFRLCPITETGGTFGQWGARFDVAEQDRENAIAQLTKLYGDGWTNLKKILGAQTAQYGKV
jgi:hypothetical protein